MSRTRPPSTAHVIAVVLLAALVPAPGQAASGQSRPPEYIDATGYLQTDEQIDAWYTLTRQLRRNFDDICGDTFCEGEYTNIQPMRYVCSVQRVTGRIGRCGWSFAASAESVEPLRGWIRVETPAWFCLSPLVPGTTIESLLDALQGEEPLYARLPHTHQTLFEGLVDCL